MPFVVVACRPRRPDNGIAPEAVYDALAHSIDGIVRETDVKGMLVVDGLLSVAALLYNTRRSGVDRLLNHVHERLRSHFAPETAPKVHTAVWT